MTNTKIDKLPKTKARQVQAKTSSNHNIYTINKVNLVEDYFVVGPNVETNRATSAKTTIKYTVMFKICLQVLDASRVPSHSKSVKKQYVPGATRCEAEALQELFKNELGRLQ